MLGYSHKDLDAHNDKRVFGSRVCRVLLTWAGLGCPGLDPLLHLQPAVGCLELAGSPLVQDGFT